MANFISSGSVQVRNRDCESRCCCVPIFVLTLHVVQSLCIVTAYMVRTVDMVRMPDTVRKH